MKSYSFIKASAKGVRFFAAIVAATMVGSVTTAIVMAAVPDSSGSIHGCYDNTGALRIVDTENSGSCTGSETAINWMQSGGNTKTVAKRASYTIGDPAATLVTIPGYGNITVDPTQCNADNISQTPMGFTNTSSETLTFASPGNGNFTSVASSASVDVNIQSAGNSNDQFYLSADSDPAKVASIHMFGHAPTGLDTTCVYYAYVTYAE